MTDFSQLLANLDQARILCVGDIMLDEFIYGEATRISPEAPVPVLSVKNRTTMMGGAGNVVRNICAIGGEVGIVALAGKDAAGEELTREINENSRIISGLIINKTRPTTCKTRFVANDQQVLRADEESQEALSKSESEALLEKVTALLPGFDVLVLSDYAKGVLSDDLSHKFIAQATTLGKPVVVDPKGTDFGKYRGATFVTPNRRELGMATGLPVETEKDIIKSAQKIIKSHNISNILVTLSADGMMLVAKDGHITKLPTKAREVFDVSGAGDTVVSMLAAGLSVGCAVEQSMQLANAAASVVVSKIGTAVAYPGEILNVLADMEILSGRAKIMDMQAAQDRLTTWRQKGQKIGFTNGCFDLIHPGHVSLLTQARAQCDKLVVGLNTDSSIKRLKGPTRPVQDEAARAAVLASLANVDMVVLFEEDTPIKLIQTFLPDLLVKGKDYTVETVIGADVVLENGGQVYLADLEDGFSTTGTIQRLQAEKPTRKQASKKTG